MHLVLHHPKAPAAVPPREYKGSVSREFYYFIEQLYNRRMWTKFWEFYSCISSSTTRRSCQLFHLGNLKGQCHEIFYFIPTAKQPKDADKILGILRRHLLLHHPQVLPADPPQTFKGTVSREFYFIQQHTTYRR